MRPEILFVDDEPDVLSELRTALQSRAGDWVLHWAEGGAEALDLLAAHDIDVLVTDLGMPGVDGVALLDDGPEPVSRRWRASCCPTGRSGSRSSPRRARPSGSSPNPATRRR